MKHYEPDPLYEALSEQASEVVEPLKDLTSDLLFLAAVFENRLEFHRRLFADDEDDSDEDGGDERPVCFNNPLRYVSREEKAATDGDRYFRPSLIAIGNLRYFERLVDELWGDHRLDRFPVETPEVDEVITTLRMVQMVLDFHRCYDRALECLEDRKHERSDRRRWSILAIRARLKCAEQICNPRLYLHATRLQRLSETLWLSNMGRYREIRNILRGTGREIRMATSQSSGTDAQEVTRAHGVDGGALPPRSKAKRRRKAYYEVVAAFESGCISDNEVTAYVSTRRQDGSEPSPKLIGEVRREREAKNSVGSELRDLAEKS